MHRLFLITAACAALVSCKSAKDSKQDRCAKSWDKMNAMVRDMARSMGGSDADLPTDADKKQFLEMCVKLPDDALACAEDPTKKGCDEILAKAAAAVPVEKVKLEWESVPVADKRATAKVPKGWEHQEMVGDTWTPPPTADLGFSTFQIRNTCGGTCEALPAAEWAKRIDAEDIGVLRATADTTITKDEKLGDTGRLVLATQELGGSTVIKVVVAQWKEGGETYFRCTADLDRGLSQNVDEFVDACRSMKIDSFSATTGGDVAPDAGTPEAPPTPAATGDAAPAPAADAAP